MPTARPPSRAKPTRMFAAHAGWISSNVAVVDDAPDDVVHVVGPRRVVGHDRVELGVHAVARIVASRSTGASARLFCGQVGEQPADGVHRLRLVAGREMRDAAATGVDRRATERLRVDLLVRHGADDVGPGDEHVARALDHHGEVGDRGRVDRAPGARPEDDRDLGHDARREDVAQEDLRVAAERRDALLDPRAAGIVEPDDRRADLHREIHDLADLLGVRLRQRTAEDREVLAVDEHQPAVDRAVAGDDAVAEDVLLVEPELRRPVGDEGVELDERVRRRAAGPAARGPSACPRACCRSTRTAPPPSSDSARSCSSRAIRSAFVDTSEAPSARDTRRPCAKTPRSGRHHRSGRAADHARRCEARIDRPPAVLSGRQRPVNGRRGAVRHPRRRFHAKARISTERCTTRSLCGQPRRARGLGRAVGFGHFRRPAGFRRAPGIPR